MIIYLCVIYVLGHLPETLHKIQANLFNKSSMQDNVYSDANLSSLNVTGGNHDADGWFHTIVDFMAISMRGLNFFIYFKYNVLFKNTFKQMFWKIKPIFLVILKSMYITFI